MVVIFNCSQKTHCGMARGVVRTARAAPSTILHGSASSSHNPQLMTWSSECVEAMILELPLIKLNFMFSKNSK